jgi:Phasin protein
MAKKESELPNLIPPEFAAMGKQRLDALLAMQKELMETLQEVNRRWFDRLQSEMTLASEFAEKLSAVHSIPETATVYQEWASKRMEMAADDAKRLLADSQKLAETGMHLVSNGRLSSPKGGGST